MRLLHLAPTVEWERALVEGHYRGSTRGLTLADVGYVHACTSSQLPGVVAAFYAGEDLSDQVLLVVDEQLCAAAGAPVRWEVPEGAGAAFPHLYGPVPTGAVVVTFPVRTAGDGALVLPDLAGLDVRTAPPG